MGDDTLGYLVENVRNYLKENSVAGMIVIILILALVIYIISNSYENLYWLIGRK